jgi:hypothetical protein
MVDGTIGIRTRERVSASLSHVIEKSNSLAQRLTQQALGVHASIGCPLKSTIRMQKNISL